MLPEHPMGRSRNQRLMFQIEHLSEWKHRIHAIWPGGFSFPVFVVCLAGVLGRTAMRSTVMLVSEFQFRCCWWFLATCGSQNLQLQVEEDCSANTEKTTVPGSSLHSWMAYGSLAWSKSFCWSWAGRPGSCAGQGARSTCRLTTHHSTPEMLLETSVSRILNWVHGLSTVNDGWGNFR